MAGGEFAWDETDEAFVIRGAGARITLARAEGRWTHRLEFGDAISPAPAPLVEAVETDPEAADPARVVSPVYQEIQRHEFAGDQIRGVCLLLTGHLFQHHFSAAVSLFRDPAEPAWIVLEFDIADRCRAPVESLAATYLVRLGSGDLEDADPGAIRWTISAEGGRRIPLEFRCEPPGRLALAEAGRGATRAQALAELRPNLFTHRLRYRWRWQAASSTAT